MHNKRKLKGFTLIELLIVVAIFGIIMTLVMSLIDPVAKIMNKTSIRERTAAYADNISEYIDNSLHYAEYMRIYYKGYCEPDFDISDSDDKTATMISEQEAVKQFVYQTFGNAVAPDPNDAKKIVPLKGRVRIMKLINTKVAAGSNTLEPGQIYESIYEFTTADEVTDSSGTVIDSNADTLVNLISADRPVINQEHYEDYNYYFKTGFYTLDPLKDPGNYEALDGSAKSYAAANRTYYSRLYPMLYEKDSDGLVDDQYVITEGQNFSVNIVSYRKENPIEIVKYKNPAGTEENMPVFKSPAHLNTATMTLTNVINSAAEYNEQGEYKIRYVRPEYESVVKEDGSSVLDKSKVVYNGALNRNLLYDTYYQFAASYEEVKDVENVYIIYIMPDEIFDTKIIYN